MTDLWGFRFSKRWMGYAVGLLALTAVSSLTAVAQTADSALSERASSGDDWSSLGSEPDSMHNYYEPRPLRKGESVMNLGLSVSLLPEPMVEQEIPAPTIDFQMKYGLSPDFSLYGTFATNYFTNVLIAGIQYNGGDESFSYSLGNAIASFAGRFDLGGEFDQNSAVAVAEFPHIQVGHKFGSVAVSVSTSATYVLYADTRIGSLEDKGLSSRFNDLVFTFAFEQPLFMGHRVSSGVSVTYSRTPYQIWMFYNVFDQFLVIPEFFFSFQL